MELPIFKNYNELLKFQRFLQKRIPKPKRDNKTSFLDKDTTSKGKIEVEYKEKNYILKNNKNMSIVVTMIGSTFGWDRHINLCDPFQITIATEWDEPCYHGLRYKQDEEKRLNILVIHGDVHEVYRLLSKFYKGYVYFAKDGVVSMGADAKEFTNDINNTLPEMWSIVNSARTHSKFYKQKCKELKLRRSYDKRGFYRFEIKKCANRFFSNLTNDNYEIIVETYQGVSPMVLIIGIRKDIYNQNKENNNVKTKEIGNTDRHRTISAG